MSQKGRFPKEYLSLMGHCFFFHVAKGTDTPLENVPFETYENKVAIMPIITEAEIPNTKTGPATVNIFPPTPIT